VGGLELREADALDGRRPRVGFALAGVAVGLRVEDDDHHDREDEERERASAVDDRAAPAALQPGRADEHGAAAVRAPFARRFLDEAAMGACSRHLTSVDIVTG